MTSVSFTVLSFSWPDGTPVFDGLDGDLGPGHIGLAGVNGAGKSTLLRLIAGELRPLRGSITVRGRLGHLRQDRSEEHTSELQSRENLVCRLLLEKKKRETS